ncbi:ShlB/FhaC/HecB family hemolysin secretion/activation protein [Methylobacillus sp.]|uniref:ShlB/FhaC/HecB family hemolysin secretion/activation protein n=1 Tax=Methylobacillus sp. TaxID=56818 RepID=UPI002FE30001
MAAEAGPTEQVPVADAEEQARFDIMEFAVSGNTVLPAGKVEAAVYPFLGEDKTIDDVEGARAALEKSFHDAGYLTVFVNTPEQEVTNKVVRLEVQEGRVEKLRVVGAKYYSLGAIKARVPQLAEGNVPYFPDVQRQMAGLNAQEDRQVAPVMRPGKTPGMVEIDLKVEDKLPLHANLEVNNRYMANTTHSRLLGSVRYDNLWQLDHSLSLSFQVTPESLDETKVFSANYLIPTAGGNYWAIYGVISRSNVDVVSGVGGINVVGDGDILGVRYINPLPAPLLSGYFHNLSVGVDYKDFDEVIGLNGSNVDRMPIKYLPFYAGYDSTLQTTSTTTQLNLGLTFAIRGLVSDEEAFFNKKNALHTESSFAHLRGDLKHTYRLPKDWQAMGRLSGQAATGQLISNEQFFLGGADTVRGYYEATAVGDKGLFGVAELRTPSLTRWLGMDSGELYASLFYSAGYTSVFYPGPRERERLQLASAGVGLQLKKWHGIYANLDLAWALKPTKGKEGTDGYIDKGDSLLHFRLGYDW